MKITQMIAAEIRRLTAKPMSILALVALIFVPILYGGLYLWANQDPYAKLDQVPAAIVVKDTGTTVNGAHVNYGDRVADQLIADGSFDWHRVGDGAASTGVDTSRYDFSITIPAGFSEALVSAAGSSPRRARVVLTTSDTNSYLASTIGSQAAEKIRASIVKEVNEQAASRLLVALSTIRGKLVTAVDGAGKLYDGAGTAQDGAAALASGTAQISSGAATLRDGLGTLREKTASLPAQTAQLADGADQVSAGNAHLAGMGDQIGAFSSGLVDQLPVVRARMVQRLQEAGLSPEQIARVLAVLDPLGTDIRNGNATVQEAVGQIDRLADGSAQVAAGADRLADATPALTAGIAQAADGSTALADGASQASVGASTLSDGLGTLHTGIGTLRDGLSRGVAQIPDSDKALRHKQAETIADPVDLKNTSITSAGGYGAGLAPFFVALAAWIGIYALFLIVKPVSRRAITALNAPLKVTTAGWLTPGLLGAVQMIGLFAIVAWALGFQVANPLGAYGLMALASLSYAAIILALNVWLRSVGQFLGLVLMVLQLVTAGGTFPWQTLPAPLAWLHHVFPMSYVVDGMRQLMYGGNPSAAWSDVWVIVVWGLGALVVAALGVVRMTRFRTLRDLEPSLIG